MKVLHLRNSGSQNGGVLYPLYRSSGDNEKYFDISEFRYNHLLY